jgi:predicted secreted protein
MKNEIIAVTQLPVIEEQLAQIKTAVSEKVKFAMSLLCTEETVKDIKKTRAELNTEFKAWEEKRKEVKAAVMTPYEQFEAVYKDCISDAYKKADNDLKAKISSVESELKAKKEQEVKEYFAEYLLSKNIDFVTYENTGINVTLSASMKSLKEAAKAFIDRVCDDLNLIDTQEHKAEILVEYKRTLNVSQAITTVTARMKAIEEEKARQEAEAARLAEMERQRAETAPISIPEPVAAPIVEAAEEKEFTLSFKVTGTKAKLRELRDFLNNGGYKYE